MGANPFLDATASGMLAAAAARFSDREALVATDRRLSYAALWREARRFARALLALGGRKDDCPTAPPGSSPSTAARWWAPWWWR